MPGLAVWVPDQGAWGFSADEVRRMRTFVVELAGHGELARGRIDETSAAWIENPG
jgi:hypothetical protein